MRKVTLTHVYLPVKDMDRAIRFYEDLLGRKVKYREENIWADFDLVRHFYLKLINLQMINDKKLMESNAVPEFLADDDEAALEMIIHKRVKTSNTIPEFLAGDIDAVFEKVKKHKTKILFPPIDLKLTNRHLRYFQCEDTEGNIIKVVNIQYKQKWILKE